MACGNGQKTPSRQLTARSEMPPPRIELGPAAPEAAVISISPRGRAERSRIHHRGHLVDDHSKGRSTSIICSWILPFEART